MTDLLNYLNEVNEVKNKLVINLNTMGVRAQGIVNSINCKD